MDRPGHRVVRRAVWFNWRSAVRGSEPDRSGIDRAADCAIDYNHALSDRSGRVTIANVPNGRYRLQVWYERSSPEDLKTLERTISISGATRSLEAIQLMDSAKFKLQHKNLYGQDYVPPSSSSY